MCESIGSMYVEWQLAEHEQDEDVAHLAHQWRVRLADDLREMKSRFPILHMIARRLSSSSPIRRLRTRFRFAQEVGQSSAN